MAASLAVIAPAHLHEIAVLVVAADRGRPDAAPAVVDCPAAIRQTSCNGLRARLLFTAERFCFDAHGGAQVSGLSLISLSLSLSPRSPHSPGLPGRITFSNGLPSARLSKFLAISLTLSASLPFVMPDVCADITTLSNSSKR